MTVSSARVPRTDVEFSRALDEQLDFLQSSADAFDDGKHAESKRLATVIRVLFHDKGSSRSLLGQLGRLDRKLISTAHPQHLESVTPYAGLIAMATGESTWLPLLDTSPVVRWLDFKAWWTETVFTDEQGARMDREALALCAANQDGGAHVDPTLDERYARLTRNGAIRWERHTDTDEAAQPLTNAAGATLRQVAHEVLRSLLPGYRKKPRRVESALYTGVTVLPRRVTDAEVAQLTRERRDAERNAAPGRNEKCPCGSGRKFKKCHGIAG